MRGLLKGMAIVVGLVLTTGLCTDNAVATIAARDYVAPQGNGSEPTCPPPPCTEQQKKCGAYIWCPPQYKSVEERVCVRPASERCETIPAEYKTVTRQVCCKPASERCETIPAEFKTVEERVCCKPAS